MDKAASYIPPISNKGYRVAKLAVSIFERDEQHGLEWFTAKQEARAIIKETNCVCYDEAGYPINNCKECPR